MQRFEHYLRAAYPIVWVNTLEPHRAERELAAVARRVHVAPAYRWDVGGGFHLLGEQDSQPWAPAKAVQTAASLPQTVTFLWNFHRFLSSIEVIQAMQNAIPALKAHGSTMVVLAPDSDKLPPELARFVVVWDFPLPTREQLGQTAEQVTLDAQLTIPVPDTLPDAALGLTEGEAEDAMALSAVERGALDPQVVAREKAGALLRQSRIEMSTFTERFDGLGGLDVVKHYTLAASRSPLSLGILLLGPPGTGKSHFAKALGNEIGVPTLSLDFGRLMSSLVGSSEANVRAALQAVDAMGRVVLFLDELEKGLAGVQSSGQLDSGVKAGVGAHFLTWMSNRRPGQAYVVATCNDITRLPPEYTRSGRFDATFWLDLPTAEERATIWGIYEGKYFPLDDRKSGKCPLPGPRPRDDGWTGAEIMSCCRTAAMLGCDLEQAGQYIIPMSRTMAEQIEALRTWAKGRAVPASTAAMALSGRRIAI